MPAIDLSKMLSVPIVPTTKPLPDVRMWSLPDRKLKISNGLRIRIFDGKGFLLGYMPLPLITACSTKADIVVKDNTSRLPKELNHYAIKKFIENVLSFCTEISIAPMTTQGLQDVEKLHICSAAEVMGMAMYTKDLYMSLVNIAKGLNNKPPSYGYLDTVTGINTEVGTALLNEAAVTLANAFWYDKIPDPDQFAAYLETNVALDNTIYRMHTKMEATLTAHEKSKKGFCCHSGYLSWNRPNSSWQNLRPCSTTFTSTPLTSCAYAHLMYITSCIYYVGKSTQFSYAVVDALSTADKFLMRQSRRERLDQHRMEDDRRAALARSCSEKAGMLDDAVGKKFTAEETEYWRRTKNSQPSQGC